MENEQTNLDEYPALLLEIYSNTAKDVTNTKFKGEARLRSNKSMNPPSEKQMTANLDITMKDMIHVQVVKSH